jgi:hypothetical protein
MTEPAWTCPYLDHPEHDPSACLHCATDEQLEPSDAAAAERERIAALADQAAREALAQSAEPGGDRIRRDSWAKALTWFAMELRDDEAARARDTAQRAEEIHAEHHPGVIVPVLDSCPEHTRAEYEELARGLTRPKRQTKD